MNYFITILLSLLFLLPCSSEAKILVKVGGYEFYPFVEYEGKSGHTIEIIKKFNQSQNKYKFQFVLTSAKRRYRDFTTGKFDVILFEDESWGWSQEKINYNTSSVLAKGQEVIIALKAINRDQSFFSNFKDKKIKLILGYHYKLLNMQTDHQSTENKKFEGISFGTSLKENLKELLEGKIDITFLNSFELDELLKDKYFSKDQILINKEEDHSYSLRAIMTPNSPIHMSEFEQLFNKHKINI